MSSAATWFEVPPGGEATATPESRGLARDEVRMLVVETGGCEHLRVRDLARRLRPGDLLVVNTSGTLPAAVDLPSSGQGRAVHVSTDLEDGTWVVEVRQGDRNATGVAAGQVLGLPGLRLRLLGPHPAGQTRLWRARATPASDRRDYLLRHGRPIRYGYLRGRVELADLQTVYALEPGSAEMPSAGRPLSEHLLVELMARGVAVAPVVLHTGVSSQEAHEPPQPERFTVPAATARLVNSTRDAGGRVVAVGTTTVRALETAADPDGSVQPAAGWTGLVLGPQRPARTVEGILTGLHDPAASHLDLLEAVAGRRLVRDGYAAATGATHYQWHELGDTMLLLP